MSIHGDIRQALRTRLLATPGLRKEQVALEDLPFVPDGKIEPYWLREQLAPGDSDLKSLNPGGRLRHVGNYFLQCFGPSEKGSKYLDDFAGSIFDQFPPGLTIVAPSGLPVVVRKCYRSAGQPEADWYQVPVTVVWFADTLNTQ